MLSVIKSPVPLLGGLLVAAVLVAVFITVAGPAQSDGFPRTASDHPDLNGIWQALGNAHWDIEPHQARAALALRRWREVLLWE